jgi:parallel beta-helix repeat protein
MASLRALLAAYDLDAGDTVHVDTGYYLVFDSVFINNEDSGVTITGPSGSAAVFDRGNTTTGAYIFELNNADNVTLDRLRLTGAYDAVFANNISDSDGLTVSNCQIYANNRSGIYLDTTNDQPAFTGNTLFGDQTTAADSDDQDYGIFNKGANPMIVNNTSLDQDLYGIYVEAAQSQISGNNCSRNGNYGLYVSGAGATVMNNQANNSNTGIGISGNDGVVTGNTVFANSSYGIYVDNFSSANDDRSLLSNNTAYNNGQIGIYGYANVLINNNVVYGQTGTNDIGIYLYSGADATGNEVYGNYFGIYVEHSNSVVAGNRVYDHSFAGIRTNQASPVLDNVVYSNAIGIRAESSFSSRIENNLIYANTDQGIYLNGVDNAQIFNNTIDQLVGDAVFATANSVNTTFRNNILRISAGYAFTVDSNSHVGFDSDYNQIQTLVTGQFGLWEGRAFTTRERWYYELGQDENSRMGDPLFIDPDGGDDILGYNKATSGAVQLIDNGSSGFSLVGTWTTKTDGGFNTNYLEATAGSGQKSATWTFTSLTPNRYYRVAATWKELNSGGIATDAPFEVYDDQTLVYTVDFNQRSAPNDFTDAGTVWEIIASVPITTGILKVVLSDRANAAVRADAVHVQEIIGHHGQDDDYHVQVNSPTIDRGDPNTYFLEEPMPNGGRADLGAYGNSDEATASAIELAGSCSLCLRTKA